MWKLGATLVGVTITMLIRRTMTRAWQHRTGGAPPNNPADDETTWKDAVVFAAVSGLAIGIARVLSDRAAAEAWRKAKGSYPPGIKSVEEGLART